MESMKRAFDQRLIPHEDCGFFTLHLPGMITIKFGKDTRPSSVQSAARILEYITDEITDKASGNVSDSDIESKLWELLADLATKQAKGATEGQTE